MARPRLTPAQRAQQRARLLAELDPILFRLWTEPGGPTLAKLAAMTDYSADTLKKRLKRLDLSWSEIRDLSQFSRIAAFLSLPREPSVEQTQLVNMVQLPPWAVESERPAQRQSDSREFKQEASRRRQAFVQAGQAFAQEIGRYLPEFYSHRLREVIRWTRHRVTPGEQHSFDTRAHSEAKLAAQQFTQDAGHLRDNDWLAATQWFRLPKQRTSELPEPLLLLAQQAVHPLVVLLKDYGFERSWAQEDFHNPFADSTWPRTVEQDGISEWSGMVTPCRVQVDHPVVRAWLEATRAARQVFSADLAHAPRGRVAA
jgi:hypothetical protein